MEDQKIKRGYKWTQNKLMYLAKLHEESQGKDNKERWRHQEFIKKYAYASENQIKYGISLAKKQGYIK